MVGRLINGIKYIALMDPNELKDISLEDNIYFTLRDIIWNGDTSQCIKANYFNGLLTNNISYEERNNEFKYTDVLHDKNSDYTLKLFNFLCLFKKDSMFHFIESEDSEEFDMNEYMNYDDWWNEYKLLMDHLIDNILKNDERRELEN
jgi:hypothetical protein